MNRICEHTILLLIALLFLGCIPETPTGNVVDPSSENYTVPTPENFSIKRLPNGGMQINMERQPDYRVSGQELFLMYNGELSDDLKFDVNASIGIDNIEDFILEFPQTYALRSYFLNNENDNDNEIRPIDEGNEPDKGREYSDLSYYTLEWTPTSGEYQSSPINNGLIFKPDFSNSQFHIELEYAPDSINFSVILDERASIVGSYIIDNFANRFNNDLDGIFRYKMKLNGYESEFVTTDDAKFSRCNQESAVNTAPTLEVRSIPFNNNIYSDWKFHDECYDKAFIYLKLGDENKFKVINLRNHIESGQLFEPDSNRLPHTFQVGGVRNGVDIYKSNSVQMIYENGRWVKDEE